MNRIVSVFGSSHPKETDEDYVVAFELGACLARAGFTVCNGGYGGTMEASARGAKSASGRTIGITCRTFGSRSANTWIGEIIETQTLVERLQKLISMGDAYVVLKGGTGTLLELAAVWEFTNKNMIEPKPIIVVGRFWTDVIRTVQEELLSEGLTAGARAITLVDSPQLCGEVLRTRLSSATQ